MRKHIIFFATSIVVCGVALSSCKNEPQTVTAPPSYKTTIIDTTTAVVYSDYSATIQSESVVEIRPKVSGYITKISVDEGQWVAKGTPLFEIDDADFQQKVNSTKAGVQSAKAAKDNALLEVKKITPLVAKGIISPFELDTKKGNLAAAEASLIQAEAAYEDALINLDYTKIKAPISGVLSRIVVREGSLVSQSGQEPLTTISADGDVYAYFSFDEKSLTPIRQRRLDDKKGGMAGQLVGKKVVELILADGTKYEHLGKLESASGLIDRTTGTIQLKVVFPNPDNVILSGSSGVVRIPNVYKGCVTIPQNATYELQDKVMVFVVAEDGTVSRKIVKVEGTAGKTYVISEGLSLGDRIVIEGADKLKDGAKITPIE